MRKKIVVGGAIVSLAGGVCMLISVLLQSFVLIEIPAIKKCSIQPLASIGLFKSSYSSNCTKETPRLARIYTKYKNLDSIPTQNMPLLFPSSNNFGDVFGDGPEFTDCKTFLANNGPAEQFVLPLALKSILKSTLGVIDERMVDHAKILEYINTSLTNLIGITDSDAAAKLFTTAEDSVEKLWFEIVQGIFEEFENMAKDLGTLAKKLANCGVKNTLVFEEIDRGNFSSNLCRGNATVATLLEKIGNSVGDCDAICGDMSNCSTVYVCSKESKAAAKLFAETDVTGELFNGFFGASNYKKSPDDVDLRKIDFQHLRSYAILESNDSDFFRGVINHLQMCQGNDLDLCNIQMKSSGDNSFCRMMASLDLIWTKKGSEASKAVKESRTCSYVIGLKSSTMIRDERMLKFFKKEVATIVKNLKLDSPAVINFDFSSILANVLTVLRTCTIKVESPEITKLDGFRWHINCIQKSLDAAAAGFPETERTTAPKNIIKKGWPISVFFGEPGKGDFISYTRKVCSDEVFKSKKDINKEFLFGCELLFKTLHLTKSLTENNDETHDYMKSFFNSINGGMCSKLGGVMIHRRMVKDILLSPLQQIVVGKTAADRVKSCDARENYSNILSLSQIFIPLGISLVYFGSLVGFAYIKFSNRLVGSIGGLSPLIGGIVISSSLIFLKLNAPTIEAVSGKVDPDRPQQVAGLGQYFAYPGVILSIVGGAMILIASVVPSRRMSGRKDTKDTFNEKVDIGP